MRHEEVNWTFIFGIGNGSDSSLCRRHFDGKSDNLRWKHLHHDDHKICLEHNDAILVSGQFYHHSCAVPHPSQIADAAEGKVGAARAACGTQKSNKLETSEMSNPITGRMLSLGLFVVVLGGAVAFFVFGRTSPTAEELDRTSVKQMYQDADRAVQASKEAEDLRFSRPSESDRIAAEANAAAAAAAAENNDGTATDGVRIE